MHKMMVRLKSGREFRFSCESYTIEKSTDSGMITRFNYEGGQGECPTYFTLNEIEAISETFISEEGE